MEQYYAASRDTGCFFSDPEKFLAGTSKIADGNINRFTCNFQAERIFS